MIGSKHFKKADLLGILILASLWSSVAYIVTFYFPYIFELILFSTAMLATFTFLLVRKIGSVTLFFSIAGLMTLPVPIFGVLGFDKIPVLALMGIFFELTAHTLGKHLNLVVAGAVSNASMPWLMLWLDKTKLSGLENAMWNFTIISSLLGLFGALTGVLVWYKAKSSKPILRFEYEKK